MAADVLDASLVGGNLSSGPCLSLSTTWLGSAEAPVRRSGAKPGDGVYLCGAVGLAAAGLRGLERGVRVSDQASLAWRRPRALIAEGLRMSRVASACIDVSDGLAGDAAQLAAASGARLVLFAEELLRAVPAAVHTDAHAVGSSALELALFGGEDYALLCTSALPIVGFACVGEVCEGEGAELRSGGTRRPLSGGFDHFA